MINFDHLIKFGQKADWVGFFDQFSVKIDYFDQIMVRDHHLAKFGHFGQI